MGSTRPAHLTLRRAMLLHTQKSEDHGENKRPGKKRTQKDEDPAADIQKYTYLPRSAQFHLDGNPCGSNAATHGAYAHASATGAQSDTQSRIGAQANFREIKRGETNYQKKKLPMAPHTVKNGSKR